MNESRDSVGERGRAASETTVDLIGLVRRNGLLLLAGVAIGALGGAGATVLAPAQWEASAVLVVANKPGASEALEPPVRTAERIGLSSFKAATIETLGVPAGDRRAALIRESLVGRPGAGDIVTFRVRAYSPEGARAAADAVVAQLRAAHEEMAKPAIDRLRNQLAGVTGDIVRAEQQRGALEGAAKEAMQVPADRRFAETVLLASLLDSRDEDLRDFRERKLELEEVLSSLARLETRLLAPPHVSEEPVWPRRSLFAAAGAALGLMLSGLLMAVRHRLD